MSSILDNAIVYLIRKERFYAELLKRMKKEQTTEVETLGVTLEVTGPKLFHNPYFLGGIESVEERAECLKHECEHLMRNHFDREKTREPDLYKDNKSILDRFKDMSTSYLFNIAEDRAINDFLPKLPKWFKIFDKSGNPLCDDKGEVIKFTPVTTASFDASFPGKKIRPREAMEYYYEFLKQNKKEMKQPSTGYIMIPLDDHSKMGDGVGELDPSIAKEMIKAIVNEAYEALDESERGRVPGHIKVLIDKLNRSDKDWTDDIKNFHANNSVSEYEETNRRRNRRYGLQYPGKRPTVVTHLVVGVDDSGSVYDKALKAIYGELENLHDLGVKLTVIECDSAIHGVYPFDPNVLPAMKGRGGTSFKPVFDLVQTEEFVAEYGKVDGLIYFTDGDDWGDVEEPPFNVLWALLPRCKVKYDWGERTFIEVKDE